MRPVSVVTSFSQKGYMLYGRAMVESFKRFWPADVDFVVYVEGDAIPGVPCVDLLQTEPCRSFLERHKGNRILSGRQKRPNDRWKSTEVAKSYNFRFDAYKFARKVFAIADAAKSRTGRLYWIDGDFETKRPVNTDDIVALLPDRAALCHLARPGYHSECGFVGYNLDHGGRAFIEAFAGVYADDSFIDAFREWHDSWVFDRMIDRLGVPTAPIPHTNPGNPVEASALARYFHHFKGKRKDTEADKSVHRRRFA